MLAVNIGNSIISFGVFEENGELISSFDISSDNKKTSDEYVTIIRSIIRDKDVPSEKIDAAIVASVVPQLTDKIKLVVRELTKKEPITVGPGVKTGFHIKIDNPSELGADIVANTASAIQIKQRDHAAIIADLGALNTLSAIAQNGDYLGCAIFPGVRLSFDAIYEGAAQLPNVNVSAQTNAIGKSSQSSMRSGVLLGNSFAIDGFVSKFAREMHLQLSNIDLIATGTYAAAILPACRNEFRYDEHLTLKGLYCIYKINS